MDGVGGGVLNLEPHGWSRGGVLLENLMDGVGVVYY